MSPEEQNDEEKLDSDDEELKDLDVSEEQAEDVKGGRPPSYN